MSGVRRVAVLTSGGDAPGMNAALRAVTRMAIEAGLEVYGIRRGYAGLLDGDFVELSARAVGGILHLGGTFLGSARCPELRDRIPDAAARLAARQVDALVVIGGNGSQAGALALSRTGVRVVGIPSTIDNDLVGTDQTLGVDTAVNIALEAIDRLRVTAASHRRGFLVEVMGRHSGHIALLAGLAGGAELVLVPEVEPALEAIERELQAVYARGKSHAIAVVSEGCRFNVTALLQRFRECPGPIGFELRATTLGHVQRGGAPTLFDRVLASRLGALAVQALVRGESGVLVGRVGGRAISTPLPEVVGVLRPVDPELLELARRLER